MIKKISLAADPRFDERCVQDALAADPGLLGFGDIELRAKERPQAGGGRLDLMFCSEDDDVAYEVETQLGAADASHLVRTIEYWDQERLRTPGRRHVAVLVAEDAPIRILNVARAVSASVPLVVFKLVAFDTGEVENGRPLLDFELVKVFDSVQSPNAEEDGQECEVRDRGYWIEKSSAAVIDAVDTAFAAATGCASGAEPSFNKYYVGAKVNGRAANFVVAYPKRTFFYLSFRHYEMTESERAEAEALGLEPKFKYGHSSVRFGLEKPSDKVLEFVSRIGKNAYAAYLE